MPSLQAQIATRMKLFSAIVDFTTKLLRERGSILEYHQGSSNTNVVIELKNFENFSFWTDFGQTMFGGNDLKIWYQRGAFRELVLHLSFQAGVKEAEAKVFDQKTDWLDDLRHLMKNKRKILAKQVKEKNTVERKNHQRLQREIINNALREKAGRLGIQI